MANDHPDFDERTFEAPPPPDPGNDWVDDPGRKYEAMGDGTKSQYFMLDEFTKSIDRHLLRDNDFTVIDMTGYKADQINLKNEWWVSGTIFNRLFQSALDSGKISSNLERWRHVADAATVPRGRWPGRGISGLAVAVHRDAMRYALQMLRTLPALVALSLVAACGESAVPAPKVASPAASEVPAPVEPIIHQVIDKTDPGELSVRRKPSADGLHALAVSLDPAAPAVALPVPARSAQFSAVQLESTAGDPLVPLDVKAMVSGEEERRVATWLRPLRLGPDHRCVLAEQAFGFEHLKRNHTLVCSHGGKQAVVWSSEEGSGPTWSSVDIKDLDGDGLDELIHHEGFASPKGAEKLDATVWKWSGSKFIQSASTQVNTLTAGTYPTAEIARKARNAARADSCRNLFWVVQAGKNHFALVAKTTANARTLAAWKDWQACYPGLKINR